MSRRDTIDSMTAGETILSAAVNAAMSVPHAKSELACIALASVTSWVQQILFKPDAINMITICSVIGEKAEHAAKYTTDHDAKNVYKVVFEAAYDFATTVAYHESMEAPSLPF